MLVTSMAYGQVTNTTATNFTNSLEASRIFNLPALVATPPVGIKPGGLSYSTVFQKIATWNGTSWVYLLSETNADVNYIKNNLTNIPETKRVSVNYVNAYKSVNAGDSSKFRKIYWYGTSFTYGVGAGGSNLDSMVYVSKVSNAIGGYPINLGRGGRNTQSVSAGDSSLYDIRNNILSPATSNSILMIDPLPNDVRKDSTIYNVGIFTAQLSAFIDVAMTKGWSASNIVLYNPFYFNPSGVVNQGNIKYRHAQYTAAMQSIASSKGTKYIDYYASMRTAMNSGQLLLSADSLHATPLGQTFISNLLSTQLNIWFGSNETNYNKKLLVQGSATVEGKLDVNILNSTSTAYFNEVNVNNILNLNNTNAWNNGTNLMLGSDDNSGKSSINSAKSGNISGHHYTDEIGRNSIIGYTSTSISDKLLYGYLPGQYNTTDHIFYTNSYGLSAGLDRFHIFPDGRVTIGSQVNDGVNTLQINGTTADVATYNLTGASPIDRRSFRSAATINYTGTTNTSGSLIGFSALGSIGSTNTTNFTNSFWGFAGHDASMTIKAGATGTVNNWVGFANYFSNASAMNITNLTDIKLAGGDNSGVGIITNRTGIWIAPLTSGINNTYLTLGVSPTATQQIGQWGMYSNYSYNNYFGTGNSMFGSSTDNGARLQVTGKATVSAAPTNPTDVLRLQDLPSPITVDAVPTSGSSNAVSSGGVFSSLSAKQNLVSLTTTGSGAATFNQSTGVLNIPTAVTSSGTVTSVSTTSNNGISGTVTNATTTPSIALTADTTVIRTVSNSLTKAQVQTALNLKANDNNVVHLTGAEFISGLKTFDSGIDLRTSSLQIASFNANSLIAPTKYLGQIILRSRLQNGTGTPVSSILVANPDITSDAINQLPTTNGILLNSIDGANYELTANKQNSLATDATNLKYPTVTAVNSALANYVNTTGNQTAILGNKAWSGAQTINNSLTVSNGSSSVSTVGSALLGSNVSDSRSFQLDPTGLTLVTNATTSAAAILSSDNLTVQRQFQFPNTPGTLALVQTTGVVNNYVASGNGSSTSIVIPHGLANITTSSAAIITPKNPASAGVSYYSIDATNVTIIYTVAPVSGTNNLNYSILIRP